MVEFTPKQQAVKLIEESQRILLLTHQSPDGDAIGSILGFFLVLKKLDKEVSAVCIDAPSKTYDFLPKKEILTPEFSGSRDFIITLDCSKAKVDKLGYKLLDNKLNIVITPKSGNFQNQDITTSYGPFKFDLTIVLDTPDLERLGTLYDKNTEIFYQTPVINIDHHSTNSHFAKVNLVDLTATSTSEILISLLEALEPRASQKLLDEDIATCLLTGITADTGSFQNTNTTPKSFTCAAQLLAAGARQQEIIKYLFKTKPLSTLKLWGKILAKIDFDENYRLAFAFATKEDLKEAGAKEEEIGGVIDELLRAVPNSDLVLLLSEREEGIHGSLRSIDKNVDCTEIAKEFGGGGHQAAAAFLLENKKIEEVKDKVLETIKEYQKKRLGPA